MESLRWRYRGREHFCTSEECASHVYKWIGTLAVLLLLFSTLVCVDFVIKYRSGLIANACCLMVLFGAGTLAPQALSPHCNCQLANQPLMETRPLIVLRC